MKRYAVACVAALFTLAMTACSSDSSSSAGASGSTGGIATTLKDFAITLGSSTAPAGEVTFDISNEGPSTHEFVVVNSDLAPDKLPVSDGEVEEDQLDSVGEQEDIAPSTTAELTLNLEPGSYVVFCNVTGHYEAGMHTGLTVS
jgi:uncharacterized cupredoxin-like copper-binding protein